MEIRGATWGDLEQVAELIGAQGGAPVGRAAVRVEHLRSSWELPGFALGEDNFVAGDDREIVGYAGLAPDRRLVLAAPDGRLADALFERIVERGHMRGDAEIRVSVLSTGSPLAELVERHPFELESETLLMWRPLVEPGEDPRPPQGISVRTFDHTDAVAVHALLDEAYLAWDARYVPIEHDAWVTSMTCDPEFDATVWWLAERNGRLAGCALHWSSGWLKDLAVRDFERGRGLGAALVQLGLAEFTRRGVRRVGLKVDAGNPTGAVRLYERLGFAAERKEAVWTLTL